MDSILAALKEPDLAEGLRPTWEPSLATFPQNARPSLLDPAVIEISREWCGLGREVDAPLRMAADRIAGNQGLCRLLWNINWQVFDSSHSLFTQTTAKLAKWPQLTAALGDQAGLFYLLSALDFAPRLRAYHRLLKIPETVTRETCQQVCCFCGNYQQAHGGKLGVFPSQHRWLRNYVRDNIYVRLGRLEFWARPYKGEATVFRHRQSGATVALAEEGACFNAEGYMDELAHQQSRGPNWTATLRITPDAVRGYPITPWGKAVRREIELASADWDRVLTRDDPVYDLHIPSGGNMGLDKVVDAFRRAHQFFRAQFPTRAGVAIVCGSWTFSPLMAEVLGTDANLVRFAREVYLHPLASTGPESLWFVFLQDKFDLATAPRETRIQRALADYLSQGHVWRNGGMFFLTDDLERLSTQHYRTQWPAIQKQFAL
ncbi:MAG: acyltransferase domain-containing protein [Kiritimatiellaeota bacterium]|nr:acyltransferase domain-containing protein [Kiritimatiellota bacterium]